MERSLDRRPHRRRAEGRWGVKAFTTTGRVSLQAVCDITVFAQNITQAKKRLAAAMNGDLTDLQIDVVDHEADCVLDAEELCEEKEDA